MHRRSDYVLDPATDRLVPIPGRRRPRPHARGILLCVFAGVTLYACAYGISNRVGNAAIMIGMGGMQPTPATLTDCQSRYVGQRKGTHQIECVVRYTVDGVPYRGHTDAMDFRWFPTRERRETLLATLEGTAVTAYVHPMHPSYARAFASQDWLVPWTWGLFTLMQWLCLLVAFPWMVVCGVQHLRRDAAPE
nr:DUF3592 domain-containing protein [Verticiella sp. GG226]